MADSRHDVVQLFGRNSLLPRLTLRNKFAKLLHYAVHFCRPALAAPRTTLQHMQIEQVSQVGQVTPVSSTAVSRVSVDAAVGPPLARQLLGGLSGNDWSSVLNRLNVPVSVREPMMSALRSWLGGGVLPAEQRPLLAQVPQMLGAEKRVELVTRLLAQQLGQSRQQIEMRLANQPAPRELLTAQQTILRSASLPQQTPEGVVDAARWLSGNDNDAANLLLASARERLTADGQQRAEKAQARLARLATEPPTHALRLRFQLPAALIEVNYSPPRQWFGWLAMLVVVLVVLSLWL
jgi:hypothetical protein